MAQVSLAVLGKASRICLFFSLDRTCFVCWCSSRSWTSWIQEAEGLPIQIANFFLRVFGTVVGLLGGSSTEFGKLFLNFFLQSDWLPGTLHQVTPMDLLLLRSVQPMISLVTWLEIKEM